jgi:hypothetical protein
LVGALLLKLLHLILEGSDLLVVLVLHEFEQVLAEFLVRFLESLKEVLLAFKVILKVDDLAFLLQEVQPELLVLLLGFFVALKQQLLFLLVFRDLLVKHWLVDFFI